MTAMYLCKTTVTSKEPYNNHNAGELLILAFFEVGFGYNVLGNWVTFANSQSPDCGRWAVKK